MLYYPLNAISCLKLADRALISKGSLSSCSILTSTLLFIYRLYLLIAFSLIPYSAKIDDNLLEYDHMLFVDLQIIHIDDRLCLQGPSLPVVLVYFVVYIMEMGEGIVQQETCRG